MNKSPLSPKLKGKMSRVCSGRISVGNFDNDQLSLTPELKSRHLPLKIDRPTGSNINVQKNTNEKSLDTERTTAQRFYYFIVCTIGVMDRRHSPYLFQSFHKRMPLKGGEYLSLEREVSINDSTRVRFGIGHQFRSTRGICCSLQIFWQ